LFIINKIHDFGLLVLKMLDNFFTYASGIDFFYDVNKWDMLVL